MKEIIKNLQNVKIENLRFCVRPVTGKIHIAPLSDAIRKGGLLGADMTTFVSYMKGACHMSYTTIQQFFKQVMELDLCRGVLCKATPESIGCPVPVV